MHVIVNRHTNNVSIPQNYFGGTPIAMLKMNTVYICVHVCRCNQLTKTWANTVWRMQIVPSGTLEKARQGIPIAAVYRTDESKEQAAQHVEHDFFKGRYQIRLHRSNPGQTTIMHSTRESRAVRGEALHKSLWMLLVPCGNSACENISDLLVGLQYSN